jgi:hypothetical protein
MSRDSLIKKALGDKASFDGQSITNMGVYKRHLSEQRLCQVFISDRTRTYQRKISELEQAVWRVERAHPSREELDESRKTQRAREKGEQLGWERKEQEFKATIVTLEERLQQAEVAASRTSEGLRRLLGEHAGTILLPKPLPPRLSPLSHWVKPGKGGGVALSVAPWRKPKELELYSRVLGQAELTLTRPPQKPWEKGEQGGGGGGGGDNSVRPRCCCGAINCHWHLALKEAETEVIVEKYFTFRPKAQKGEAAPQLADGQPGGEKKAAGLTKPCCCAKPGCRWPREGLEAEMAKVESLKKSPRKKGW